MTSLLDNIRVIDVTQALAGPYCTMLLGDMGADVIKVETPGVGDQSRGWGPPFVEGESTYYLSINRNKRSLTLDIKSPEGQKVLHQLVASADVFVCNIPKESSRQRAGVDVATLQALNPRLIYCLISGYGSTGPYAERPGYDLIAQGEAGLMSVTGEPDGEPIRYPIPIADITTGLYSTIGILASLFNRERTGQGQALDMTLMESQSAWLTMLASALLNGGQEPQRLGNLHPNIVPYQVFKTKDKYIILTVGTEKLWQAFCQSLGLEYLKTDPRFATNKDRAKNRAELIPILDELFSAQTADYWLEKLKDTGIPTGPINTIADTLAHPQHRARHFIVELEHPLIGVVKSMGNPVNLSATPVSYRLAPPTLGQHTGEVLAGLGYDEATIAQFREQGVV
ncbi:MAG: CaiB/BaiF CoA-transferase family protein [Anaerolineae bacterium]|nr:CoA transferase [Anaerolineales bacterium]MCQ3973921.1 CoA transferase [Anaerolineae bacterium]